MWVVELVFGSEWKLFWMGVCLGDNDELLCVYVCMFE